MRMIKLTVSRVQCRVQVQADGTATVVSCGKGPTLWRSQYGPWSWLHKDEIHVLADGDLVSLDWHNPEAAVFVCTVEGQGAIQQGFDDAGVPLPYPWEQLVDQNGAAFYSNPETGVVQWEAPQQYA